MAEPSATAASPGERDGHPAVRAAGLFRAYGEEWVLRDVSLELGGGESLAILGANGAGKSTLLRILATLLRPTEGEAVVLGCSLPGEAWRLRGRIGYLGHSSLLYRDLTAEENLRFAVRLFGLGEPGRRRAGELLERVGLAHRARTRVGEMSAGMTQRLAICRAVLHEPELLLLDEPLAHLDPAAAATVTPLIGPAPGRTRVVVSHDVAAALAEADRVLALTRDGAVALEGAAAGLGEQRVREVYAERSPARAGAGR
jgi:heme exporter protein A